MTSMIHGVSACEVVKRLEGEGIQVDGSLFISLVQAHQAEYKRALIHFQRIQEFLRQAVGRRVKLETITNHFLAGYNHI